MSLTANSIRKDIEKRLKEDVKYTLDELDIDNLIEDCLKKLEVKDIVKNMIHLKLGEIIQEKAFSQIKKNMPIIDAWTNEQVQEFLYKLGVKP